MLNREQLQNCKDRWDLQRLNEIVIALNNGQDIKPIIKEMDQDASLPPCFGSMDLRGINLSHQNLRGPWRHVDGKRKRIGVNLEGVDLNGADLSWALMPWANLKGARLRDVNLYCTELIYADLMETDLAGANLTGVWLLDTKMYRAIVTLDQLESRRKLGQLDFDYHAYEI